MRMPTSGIALITVVVFILLLSIVAIAAINLMANQAILIEHQVKRIKAYYVAEAAQHLNWLRLFLGLPVQDLTIDSTTARVSLQDLANEPVGTDSLVSQVNY